MASLCSGCVSRGPQILILGARFEQARGDTAKAIKYYRASLRRCPRALRTRDKRRNWGFQDLPLLLACRTQTNRKTFLCCSRRTEGNLRRARQAARAHPIAKLPEPGSVASVRRQVECGAAVYDESGWRRQCCGRIRQRARRCDARKSRGRVRGAGRGRPGARSAGTRAGCGGGLADSRDRRRGVSPVRCVYCTASTHISRGQHRAGSDREGSSAGATWRQHATAGTGADGYDGCSADGAILSKRPRQPGRRCATQVNAARAARIRKLQEDAAARTGQSQPPPEQAITATPQNAEYTQAQNQGSSQVPQPPSGPSGQFGKIPDTGAQQYPQPRTPLAPEEPATVRSRPSTQTPAPAPAAGKYACALPAPIAPPQPAPATTGPPPLLPLLQRRIRPSVRPILLLLRRLTPS